MSNIYLNEFDRFMSHDLKPLAYMRYGDDWLCFMPTQAALLGMREEAINHLAQLKLSINQKVDVVKPVHSGVSYLGVDIWPTGRRLQPSVRQRIDDRMTDRNAASYIALIAAHEKPKRLKQVFWKIAD